MGLGADGTQPDSAGLVQPLDNGCTKVLGPTRTYDQLAEFKSFSGLFSAAARLVQITTSLWLLL